MRQIPDVSVIVPCYKQAEFLDECISSVLEQTFQNWECIIIDDGSPDNTYETAKKWTEKDTRIKYYKKNNGGLCSARNYGISLARGKYVLPLDADDKIGKRYMELALPYFKINDNIKIVYCKAELFGEMKGEWHLPKYSLKRILIGNIIFCSAFFPKIEWERIGGYDINMTEGLEDWEFWINMMKEGGEVVKLDTIQFYYRKKKESMITEIEQHYNKLACYIYEKHCSLYNKIFGNPSALYQDLHSILNSKEYRLGKIIFYIPKKIWRILKKTARLPFLHAR